MMLAQTPCVPHRCTASTFTLDPVLPPIALASAPATWRNSPNPARSRRRAAYRPSNAVLGGSAQLVQECSVDNWKSPLKCDAGVGEQVSDIVVALGKFDAMHIGHRSLAVKASSAGCQPVLLSFSGIAQVLGLPVRLPLVAAVDRPRVLASWAPHCNGRLPRQRTVPFHEIRTMSPEQFVAMLAQEMGAAGVVAGRNYRFGFKAAGDARALQELGAKYGMRVHILDLVSTPLQPTQQQPDQQQQQQQGQQQQQEGQHQAGEQQQQGGSQGSGAMQTEEPQEVSSSKIRQLLAGRDVQSVQRLLGRQYRLVAGLPPPETLALHPHNGNGGGRGEQGVLIPAQCFLNMPPAPGSYAVTVALAHRHHVGSEGGRNGNGNGYAGSGLNGDGRQQGEGDAEGLQNGLILAEQGCECELSIQGLRLRKASQNVKQMLEHLVHGDQAHPAYLVLDFGAHL